MRQWPAIHFICDERRLLDRFPNWNAFHEIGRFVEERGIGAVEYDFDSVLLEPNQVEHILEPGTLPARAPHRTLAPLHTGDVGLKESPAPAGTLTNGGNLEGRQLFQLFETDLQVFLGAFPADTQLPCAAVDLRNVGNVVAHEKLVIGSDWSAQIAQRCLVIGWSLRQPDQRFFAGKRFKSRFGADACGQRARLRSERW